MKLASIVSAVALMAFGATGVASAQSYGDESTSIQKPKVSGQQSDFCIQNPDQCQPRRMKRAQTEVIDVSRKQAQNDWQFDSNRHERRRNKDAQFRFFFGGYWYPEQYWLGASLPVQSRVSCGEGRLIVRDRGFNRVQTVECQGRTYTYLGRRNGNTFKVLLSARSGRVIEVDRV
jgi:hypothetical protein